MGTSSATAARAYAAAPLRTWAPGRLGTYYRLAAAILGDERAAAEATLAGFEDVWQRRRRFPDARSFEGHLMRDVMRECLESGRAARRGDPNAIDEDEARAWQIEHLLTRPAAPAAPAVEAPAPAADPDLGAAAAIVRRLGVEERAMLVLRYVTDLDTTAIADVLEQPVSVVERSLARIEAALAAAIADSTTETREPDGPLPGVAGTVRRLIPMPAHAPLALINHAETRMALVTVARTPRLHVPLRFAVPVGLLLAAFIVVGTGAWRAFAQVPLPVITADEMPQSVDLFGRVNASTAWVLRGDDLFVTHDGGTSWTKGTVPAHGPVGSYVPSFVPSRYYPFFTDDVHGWLLSWQEAGTAAGNSTPSFRLTVHRTADAGRKWTSVDLPGTYPGFGSIQFVDDRHGWILVSRLDTLSVGMNVNEVWGRTIPAPSDATTILSTSDGGQTWTRAATLAAVGPVRFASEKEGWGEVSSTVGGSADLVVHTTDGGRTWTNASLPQTASCYVVPAASIPAKTSGRLSIAYPCMALSDPSAISVAALESHSVQAVESSDGGKTWTPGSLLTTASVSQASLQLTLMRVAPEQPLLTTTNGSMPSLLRYAGPAGTLTGATVSFDAGATWGRIPIPTSLPIEEIQFVGPRDAWIEVGPSSNSTWGGSGSLYATSDGGASWRPLLRAKPIDQMGPGLSPAPGQTGPASSASSPISFPGSQLVFDAGGLGGLPWIETETAVWVAVGTAGAPPTLGWTIETLPQPGDVDVISPVDTALWTAIFHDGATDHWMLPLYLSSNAGTNWERQNVDLGEGVAGQGGFAATAHFVDAAHGAVFVAPLDISGFSMGGCSTLITSDAGRRWDSVSSPCVLSPQWVDPMVGWDASWSGIDLTLHVTKDGGRTWTDGIVPPVQDAVSAAVQAVGVMPNGNLVAAVQAAVGGSRTPATQFYLSADGSIWNGGPSVAQRFTALALSPNGTWIGAVSSPSGTELRQSLDGGSDWRIVPQTGLPGSIGWMQFGVDGSTGWALPSGPCSGRDYAKLCVGHQLYTTTDGGSSWTVVWPPAAISIPPGGAALP